jgi:hypothetical protein
MNGATSFGGPVSNRKGHSRHEKMLKWFADAVDRVVLKSYRELHGVGVYRVSHQLMDDLDERW